MQGPPRNPDARPLPEGWAEHFDSQRKLWYYIDLNASSPRVTFVHPFDSAHPASAPVRGGREQGTHSRLAIRPAGSRENPSPSANAVIRDQQRARRATVAQQLYASSLAVGSHRNPSSASLTADGTSRQSPRRLSVSSSLSSDKVASSSATLGPSSSSSYAHPSSNSTTMPAAANTSPSSLTHLDSHDPRYFFDCTRLSRGTRRMTYTGPQPGPSSGGPIPSVDAALGSSKEDRAVYSAQALYPASVVTSPPPVPPPPPTSSERQNQRRSSMTPTISILNEPRTVSHNNSNWNVLPPPVVPETPEIPTMSSPNYLPDENLYTAITEDNLMVMPTRSPSSSPSHFSDVKSSYAAITEDNLMVMPSRSVTQHRSKRASTFPIDVAFLQEGQSRPLPQVTRNSSVLLNQPIIQPKPVKPLKGVSLNLQVQVASTSDSPEQAEGHPKNKRNSQILKNLGLA